MDMQHIDGGKAAEDESVPPLERRRFLKAAGMVAAGAALPLGAVSWALPAAVQAAPGNARQTYTMKTRNRSSACRRRSR